MKYSLSIIVIIIILFTFSLGSVSFAFVGPGSLTPGTGNGALQVDSNLNIGFGTNLATPTGDATNAVFGRVFTIASTSDPGISLRNLGGGRNYTMYSRANGRFVIWDDFSSRPRFFIDANGFVGISGNSTSTYFFTPASALHVAGSIQSDAAFVGAVAPSSITGGAFQATNYAFPSAIGIGTTTISGLPTNGMYVAGNVGIGTISPGAKLDVVGPDSDNAILARFYANTSSRGSFIIRNGTGSNPTTFIGTAGSNEHLAIGAVNAERIRIAPGGNVGIGSTNPNAPLEIGTQGSIQGTNVNLILSGSGGYPGIQFWNASGVSRTIIRQDSTNDRLAIFTNTGTAAVPVLTEKLTLLNSGNFGIGIATPAAKVHIYGEGATDMIRMTANYATPQVWTQYVDSGGWYLKQDATFPFHVHSGGNVGIGTTTPGSKLTVAGVIESTTGGIKFPDGTTQVTAGGGTGTSVGWSRTGTNVYLTTSTDWVGVGTTTPTQALDVRGNIYVSGNIVTGGTMTTNVGASNVSAGSFGTTAGKGNYRFEGAATTNDVLKVDATNERVGVGTGSPVTKLQVTGPDGSNPIITIGTLNQNTGNAALKFYSGNNSVFNGYTIQYNKNTGIDRLEFVDGGGSPAITFVNGGNVGIGTTTPSQKLEVNGNIKLTSGGYVYGNGSNAYLYLSDAGGSKLAYSSSVYLEALAASINIKATSEPIAIWNNNGNIRLAADGTVGIGATSPVSKLEVRGSTTTITITDDANNYNLGNVQGTLYFNGRWWSSQTNPSADTYGDAAIRSLKDHSDGMGGTALTFLTAGSGAAGIAEKMRITKDGYIGIGTTTPTNALDVVGNIRATGNIISGGTMTANVSAPNVSAGTFGTTAGKGNYTFEAAANTNNVLKVDATNERVGVGTASPATSLHVKGAGWIDNIVGSSLLRLESTDAVGAGIAMKNTNGNYWNIYNGGASSWAGQGKLAFVYSDGVTGATGPKMVIDTSGNVGIGTNSPGGRLHIAGTSGSVAGSGLVFNGNTAIWQPSDAALTIRPAGSDIATFINTGVGIGITAPEAKLQVQGAIKMQNTAASSPDTNFRKMINVTSYQGGGTSRTGILVVKLPTPLAHSMAKIKISGWSYTKAWDLVVSGYMNPDSGWTQVGGSVATGNPPFNLSEVRLAFDNPTDTFYILLGSASTAYGYYASVGVDVESIYSNALSSQGWDVYIAAADPTFTGSVTPTVSLYGSSNALISSSVGIGTTTPANALDVVGNIRATGNIIAGGTMTANVSAPNVSAGTFGTTAGKGNYTFEAAANTNNVLKVDATNERVGIGTAAPESLLHLKASNGVTGVLKIEGGNDNVVAVGEINSQLDFGSNDTSVSNTGNVGGRIASVTEYNNGAWAGLAFYTFQQSRIPADLAEVMRITNAGNVGIGTTSPSQKLEVNGIVRINDSTPYVLGNVSGIQRIQTGPGNFQFANSSNAYADIYAGSGIFSGVVTASGSGASSFVGNVGIGTASPGHKLDVVTTATTTYNPNAYNPGQNMRITFGSGDSSYGMIRFASNGSMENSFGVVQKIGSLQGDFVFQSYDGSAYGERMRIMANGNVGIATSSPAYKLAVNGTGYFANPVIVGSPTDVSHATTKSYVDSLVTGGATSGNLATLIVTGTTTLASTGGKVIIGGAGPALKLDVTGQGQFTDTMSATKYYDYNDTAYYLDPANTGTALKLAGSLESGGSGTSYVLGNTLIGVSTNPGSYKFAVSGTSYFNNQVTIAANLLMGASQNITLQSGNITGVNKITAAVIDPLYEIDGEKYATYGSDTVGVKTEMFAKASLLPISNFKFQISNKDAGEYAYIIDFAKAERGSDLWVFWQTIKEGNDMKDITLTLTPEGKPAELWYELNPKEKQVVVYGDAPVTFSYHLVAPRHDAETWTTKRGKTEEKASFILKAR